jgi:glycosyltransferase involved in cell wall biosynthesis
MRVTFDDQIFTFQRRGGVARYFTELFRTYRSEPELDVEAVTPFRYVVNEHLLELDPERYRRAKVPDFAQRARVLRPLNRVLAGRHRQGSHLVHHTYYLPDALRMPAAARLCTVYDMMPEKFPELFPHGNPHAAKREYVRDCDAVLCISQTTKDDLLATYGPLDKPVVVTPLGVGEEFFVEAVRGPEAPDYILHIGQRKAHKNFDVLLRGFAQLATDRSTTSLVCVGPPFDTAEIARLRELHLLDRVECRTADDEELPFLLASANCFVFPSRYEGFGLPIVEAFAAGCPVLLADTPCSREVGGKAAQYFPPDDAEHLAGLIDALLKDPANRIPWVEAGRQRAREFTWLRTAQLTSDVYRELMPSP